MKIDAIYHSAKERKQGTKGEPRLRRYNKQSVYHPMLLEREYVRALNSVKMERMFAKPFVAAFEIFGEGLWCVSKDPATPFFATASYDNKVTVWDINTRRLVDERKYEQRIASLSYSTRAGLFVAQEATVVSGDHVYNMDSLVTALDYSSSFDAIAVASSKDLTIFDVDRHSLRSLYTTSGTTRVRFNPSFKHIIGAVSQKGVSLFDNRVGKEITTLDIPRLNCLEFNPRHGHTFSVGSSDGNGYLFDIRNLENVLNVYRGHVGSVVSLCYSPDGKEVATGSFDHTIRIFGVEDRKSRDCYYNDRMHIVYGLAYSNDGQFIVSGSDDGSLRLWKAQASKKTGPISRHEKSALEYREALKEKFKNVAEVSRISKHRFLPRLLKQKMRTGHEAHEASLRREEKIRREREKDPESDRFLS